MDLNQETIGLLAGWYAVFVMSTTLHEAAHAWAALRMGDPTAYAGGQVTLNPLPHMAREPIGMVVFPIASFLLGGWMMGWASAPYDPAWAGRYPRRAALMALAGPAANLLLVLVAGIAIRAGLAMGAFTFTMPGPGEVDFSQIITAPAAGPANAAATLLSIAFMLNLLLFVFNLLPLPPLDGSAAISLFLPRWAAARYQEFMRQPMFQLMGLFVAWKLCGKAFIPVMRVALNVLYPAVG